MSLKPSKVVVWAGIEPATHGFSVHFNAFITSCLSTGYESNFQRCKTLVKHLDTEKTFDTVHVS
jgi:hypothetical protein